MHIAGADSWFAGLQPLFLAGAKILMLASLMDPVISKEGAHILAQEVRVRRTTRAESCCSLELWCEMLKGQEDSELESCEVLRKGTSGTPAGTTDCSRTLSALCCRGSIWGYAGWFWSEPGGMKRRCWILTVLDLLPWVWGSWGRQLSTHSRRLCRDETHSFWCAQARAPLMLPGLPVVVADFAGCRWSVPASPPQTPPNDVDIFTPFFLIGLTWEDSCLWGESRIAVFILN